MAYDRYPAVDENYLFPPEVREAQALSTEFRNQVVPLTQTQRNNLAGDELWDGRLVMNLTTRRIDMYDLSSGEWLQMTTEPAGIVKEYGGDVAPDFHVLADGSVYDRTGIYAALFAVYGTKYNTGGELSTQFRVPNRKGKVAVGMDSGQIEFNALGKTGGAKTHTLTTAEMPSHNHTQNAHDHGVDPVPDHQHALSTLNGGAADYASGTGRDPERYVGEGAGRLTSAGGGHTPNVQAATATNQAAGGGGAHNNLQPYIAMNFIITL